MSTAKQWIEYVSDWRSVPMAYWVHVEQDGKHWRSAERFLPAAPVAVPHKGYAVLCVQLGDTVLRFSSAAQLAECIRVLSMKPLPTSRRLSVQRGSGHGPNSHWLSRLPASIKGPKQRAHVVEVLRQTRFRHAGA
jgi:hypothetical protein